MEFLDGAKASDLRSVGSRILVEFMNDHNYSNAIKILTVAFRLKYENITNF